MSPFRLARIAVDVPLSADGERVTQIVSYADWRSRGDAWQQLFASPRHVG